MSTPSTTASVLLPDPEQPFTGPLADLDRLARVAVGTVVVVFTGEKPPTLRQPGELLIPRLTPFGHRVATVPVTIRPVNLAVSIDGLGTADGDVVEHVELHISLRFDPAEDHAIVGRLAAERGPSFADSLMQDVLRGVETAVRAAVGLNRSSDLRRQSLADLLSDHWMPSRLAANALLVENVTVPVLRWSGSTDPGSTDPDSTEDTVEIAKDEPSAPTRGADLPLPDPMLPDLMLSDDARLHRRWEQRTNLRLRAVSTGRTTGARTAIAVLVTPLDLEVATRIGEELVDDDDTLDAMLVVVGATYVAVVTSWFALLAHDGARLAGIDASDDLSELMLQLVPTRHQDVPFDLHDPAVDALRQLLPFDLVTFEVAS